MHTTKLVCVTLFCLAGADTYADEFDDLLQMSEQLDMVDSMDFTEHVAKAEACTRVRDFACAERELAYEEQQAYERRIWEQEERERLAREDQARQDEETWCNPNRPQVCGGGGRPTTYNNGVEYDDYEEAASDYNPGVAEYVVAAQQDQAENDRRAREQENDRLAALECHREDDRRRQAEADSQRLREHERQAALQAKTDYLNRLAAGTRLKAMGLLR